MQNILAYVEKFFAGEYELRVHAEEKTVTTDFTQIIKDTVPSGYEGLIVGVASDNTLDGQLSIKVKGKDIDNSPFDLKALPGKDKLMYLMVKLDSRDDYEVQAKGNTGSITVPVRLVILLRRR